MTKVLDPITKQRGAELEPHFTARGWKILHRIKGDDLDWWADEMWIVQCGSATIHLTFLVDPQDYKSVWAIGATREMPSDRMAASTGAEIRVRRVWDKDLPAWLDALNVLMAAPKSVACGPR